jgi:hypothetical protein
VGEVCWDDAASGLLWISELIEENTRTAKLVGQRGIYVRAPPSHVRAPHPSQAIIALHGALYLSDALPLPKLAFSAACHAVYLQNFGARWPAVPLASAPFAASCALVVADHFLWFFHFAKAAHDARQRAQRAYGRPVQAAAPAHGFAEIATFFVLCVWLAPLFLFLSLSSNDSALPTMSGTSPKVNLRPPHANHTQSTALTRTRARARRSSARCSACSGATGVRGSSRRARPGCGRRARGSGCSRRACPQSSCARRRSGRTRARTWTPRWTRGSRSGASRLRRDCRV